MENIAKITPATFSADIKEEKLNVVTPKLNENSNKNAFESYFKTGENLKTAVSVFGQSEEEIEREFKNFKAQKLFGKLDYLLLSATCIENFIKECETALKYNFNAVTVLPNYVKRAKLVTGVKVNALISYPYGEDLQSVKLNAVKRAFLSGADGVTVAVSVLTIKNGGYSLIEKEFAKYVKKAGNRSVNALIDVNKLSPTEAKKTVETLLKISKLNSIIPYNVTNVFVEANTVKEVVSLAGGKCIVGVGGKIQTAEETVSALALGVGKILSEKCPDLAKDALKKLGA